MTWNIDLECRDAEDARRERNHRVFNGGNMSEHDLNQMHDFEDQMNDPDNWIEYNKYLDDLERENPFRDDLQEEPNDQEQRTDN